MYDLIIIGCGPAGMTAAIYAARANKRVLLIEKETIGGQMASAPLIENYPGFKSVLGSELADAMFEQVTALHVEIEIEEVDAIYPGSPIKVHTADENEYETKSLIIASGAKYKTLPVAREEELRGKGIHFCVSCDGAFYKDKTVAVVGGAASAVGNALLLSTIAKNVYLIYHGKQLRAEAKEIDKLNKSSNVEVLYETEVTDLCGDDHLNGLIVEEKGKKRTLDVDGAFISIGMTPETEFLNDCLKLDEKGFIASSDTETPLEGIFVAGDCRTKDTRQITVAVSDGTIAAIKAIKYLNDL